MTHKVCKYRLNANGTIPDFLCFDNAGIHGVCVVADMLEPSPRDNLMVGVTVDNPVGDFETFASKEALQDYISSCVATHGWTQLDPNDPNGEVAFDAAAEATRIWDACVNLNP
jgi:hypothetical protein